MGVCLAQESLDIHPLRACIDVPVDEARIVAFVVHAVLGEFLAEAEFRRAVQADQEALDDGAGDEVEVFQVRQDLRLQ